MMINLNPLLSLQYVSKSFGRNPLAYDSMVLKNVSVNIHDGEFIIIYGPSGSGKSTFLNLLAGLELPTAGRILLRDHNMADLSGEELAQYHRRKIGMVFQNFNLIKSLRVWENVALPQAANGTRYTPRRKRALELLELLGLKGLENRQPNELSGGQQQRVAIARALVNNPYLLLIDEPTGNLDTAAANEVMQIINNLHTQASHTLVLVTHNPNYLQYATRVFYMQDGQIIKEVRPQQLAMMQAAAAEPITQNTIEPILASSPVMSQEVTQQTASQGL
jgi:ABC-type lipoprotein export system ATPase subunit